MKSERVDQSRTATSSPQHNEIVTLTEANSASETIKQCVSDNDSPSSVSASNEDETENTEEAQQTVLFSECHWYDIPCPHSACLAKGVRFDSHEAFKVHHERLHCPRAENGDIDRAKNSLRWRCPVRIDKEGDGELTACNKISNSWYNYAGHITSHRQIGHGWGCALPPQGKRRKTNVRRNGRVVCGKRTSTKHHLLAHMNNVHKAYKVIDEV